MPLLIPDDIGTPLDSSANTAVNTSPSALIIPQDIGTPIQSTTPQDNSDPVDAFNHTMGAFGRGAMAGVGSIAATLGKAAVKFSGVPAVVSNQANEAIQSGVNALDQNVQQDRASGHKIASYLGEATGLIGASAAIPIPGASAAYKASEGVMGASGLINKAVNVGAGLVGGAVQGGVLGGAMTLPNQDPNQLFNTESARLGAGVGLIGGAAEMGLNRYANKLTSFEDKVSSLNPTVAGVGSKVKYNGATWEGMTDLKNGIVDTAFGKLSPYLSNDAYLANTSSSVKDAIKSYIGKVAEAYPINKGNIEGIAQVIQRTGKQLDNVQSSAWKPINEVLKTVPQATANSTKSLLPELEPTIKDYVKNKMVLNQFNNIDNLTGDQLFKLKQDLYKTSIKGLSNRISNGTATNTDIAAHSDLMGLYQALKEDVAQTLNKTSPDMMQQFYHATSITDFVHDFTDAKTSKTLMDAIEDASGHMEGVNNFVNYMTGSGVNAPTTRTAKEMLGAVGDDGRMYLQSKMLQDALNSATKNDQINLNTLINNLQKTTEGSTHLITRDAIDSLKGLMTLGQQVIKAGSGKTNPVSFTDTALKVGGAVSTAVVSPLTATAAGIGITGRALGVWSRAYSPVKRMLSLVNQTSSKAGTDPKLAQYIINKAANNLTKLGVMVTVGANGAPIIDSTSPASRGSK